MEIKTSYFYQIRHFKPNYIPISTACWDPKWFHDNRDNSYIFKDSNGVYNGIRCEELHPGDSCHNLCSGQEGKDKCGGDPFNCLFLKKYKEQLDALNFEKFLQDAKSLANRIAKLEGLKEEDIVLVFIVYETPDNKCSERGPLTQWFNEHGVKCTELEFTNAEKKKLSIKVEDFNF